MHEVLLKLKDRVRLSPSSLYARKIFQRVGNGHIKIGDVGIVTKVLDGVEEGCYTVKFKDGKIYTTNVYRGNMLLKEGKANG